MRVQQWNGMYLPRNWNKSKQKLTLKRIDGNQCTNKVDDADSAYKFKSLSLDKTGEKRKKNTKQTNYVPRVPKTVDGSEKI